jgi:hypothetical protein
MYHETLSVVHQLRHWALAGTPRWERVACASAATPPACLPTGYTVRSAGDRLGHGLLAVQAHPLDQAQPEARGASMG